MHAALADSAACLLELLGAVALGQCGLFSWRRPAATALAKALAPAAALLGLLVRLVLEEIVQRPSRLHHARS